MTDRRVRTKDREQHHFAQDRPAKSRNLFKHKDRTLTSIPGEPLRLEDYLTDMVLSQKLEPGCRTYRSSRFYQMRITATINCMGESYDVNITKDVGKKEDAPLFDILPKLKKRVREPVSVENEAVVNKRYILKERLEKLARPYEASMKENGRQVKEGDSFKH